MAIFFHEQAGFNPDILPLAKISGCDYEVTMSRVKIKLPEKFIFSTEIKPRITEINYGGHLGNDAFLSIVHEARARFLAAHHWSEMDIDGYSLIMADAAIMYLAEVFYGTALHVELAVTEMSRIGCDFVFRLSNQENGQEAARVKTGMVFFDYQQRKVVRMPEVFRKLIEQL